MVVLSVDCFSSLVVVVVIVVAVVDVPVVLAVGTVLAVLVAPSVGETDTRRDTRMWETGSDNAYGPFGVKGVVKNNRSDWARVSAFPSPAVLVRPPSSQTHERPRVCDFIPLVLESHEICMSHKQ